MASGHRGRCTVVEDHVEPPYHKIEMWKSISSISWPVLHFRIIILASSMLLSSQQSRYRHFIGEKRTWWTTRTRTFQWVFERRKCSTETVYRHRSRRSSLSVPSLVHCVLNYKKMIHMSCTFHFFKKYISYFFFSFCTSVFFYSGSFPVDLQYVFIVGTESQDHKITF